MECGAAAPPSVYQRQGTFCKTRGGTAEHMGWVRAWGGSGLAALCRLRAPPHEGPPHALSPL